MKKNNLMLDENFEIESLKVEFGLKETLSINDLTEEEKEEIFGNSLEMKEL
jgi:hypothetical protein